MEISVVTRKYKSVESKRDVFGVLAMVEGIPYCYIVYSDDYKKQDDRDDFSKDALETEAGGEIPRHVFRQILIGSCAYNYRRLELGATDADRGLLDAAKKGFSQCPIVCPPFRVGQVREFYALAGRDVPELPEEWELRHWLHDFQNGQFIRGTVITVDGIDTNPQIHIEGVRTF